MKTHSVRESSPGSRPHETKERARALLPSILRYVSPRALLAVATLCALSLIVVLPIAAVALQAVFPDLARGSFRAPFGAVGDTFGKAETWRLLGNTVRLGCGVAISAGLLGTALGAIRGLFRLPFARVWDTLFLIPFLVPPYLATLSWLLLLQPAGYLQQVTGVNLGSALFSMPGLVAVMTLTIFPVVYFAVSRAVATIGPRLADVARVHGAGSWQAVWRITLPLAWPAIAGSILLAFTMAVEEYGAPAALGSRAGIDVLVTAIEARFSDWPVDLPGASLLSMLLAALAIAAFFMQQRTLAGRDFSVQNGKPAAAGVRSLGRWQWPVTALFAIFGVCATILPLTSIAATAFSRTLSGGLSAANLTIGHFTGLFASDNDGVTALATSAGLAAATALVTAALGFACAWCATRTRWRARAAIDLASMLPHAIPGIVVGVGLILAWNLQFWPITPYGTWGILLLSYSCILLPYPVRYVGAALRQSAGTLEYAARVHGATPRLAMWRITLPLVMPAVTAAAMIVFALASRELVTSLLLAPSGVDTVSIFIWRQFEQGSVGDGMAMGLVSVVVSSTLLGLSTRLSQRIRL